MKTSDMGRKKIKRILTDYIENNISKEIRTKLDEFYNSRQSVEFNWEKQNLSERDSVKQEIWSHIQSAKKQGNKIRPNIKWLKIAAVILLFLTASSLLYYLTYSNLNLKSELIEIETQFGETKEILLADSSIILLNSGSKLSYYQPFKNNKREIKLSGEAFFKVSKDTLKPFVVYSNQLTTTVLGTSFNIRSYFEDSECVTVSSGKVKVAYISENNKAIQLAYLEPSQQALLNKESATLIKQFSEINPNKNWTNNYLVFNNKSLSIVLTNLERIYNVHFKYENNLITNKSINTTYQNANLEEILDEICFMTGLKYQFKTDNSIIIFK